MNVFHKVATNTGILYLRMAITVFISLYTTRLLLTSLGIENFGLYSLIGGVIAMFGFLNSAMAAATQRFISIAQGAGDIEKIKRIFNMSNLLHASIALLIVLMFEIAGHFLFNGLLNIDDERLEVAKLVYQFMVASTLFAIISVPYEAILISRENMLFYAILGVAESVFKLAIALYISYGSLHLPIGLSISKDQIHIIYSTFDALVIYGLLMTVLSILMLLTSRIYCHKKYAECEVNLKKHFDKNLLQKMASFASWSFLGSASSIITHYSQGIVMNVFFGAKVNAAQGVTNQLSGQLGAFATTMIKALNPMIVKSEGSGNRDLALKATMLGSKISFFLLMILYVPILVEMPYIFKIWLKNVPEYTVIFCKLLLTRCLIDQMFSTLYVTISAVGNIASFQLVTSILQFLPLLIAFYLFKLGFPPPAIYVVYLIYSLVNSALILFFSKKLCGFPVHIFLKDVIARCVFSFFFVYLLTSLPLIVMNEGISRLICVSFTSSISFLIVIWLVGFTQKERSAFKSYQNILLNKHWKYS